MAVPDRLCVITYVSQLHAHFKNCPPENGLVTSGKKEAIGRNWRDKAGELPVRFKYIIAVIIPSLKNKFETDNDASWINRMRKRGRKRKRKKDQG